jgi:hypothetical protein
LDQRASARRWKVQVRLSGGDFPFFGDAGDGVGVLGVHRGEALHEVEDDLGVGEAGDEMRVEVGGLGEVADVECLRAVTGGDAGLGAAAGGREQ